MNEWVKLEDKYSNAGQPVLICINGLVQNITYFYDYLDAHKDWFEPVYFNGDSVLTSDVTHWMPLPKPPEGTQ